MSQIHKRVASDRVKELLEHYSKKEIEGKYIQEILGIGKSRFFMPTSQSREHSQLFTIQYERNTHPRVSKDIEQNILKELSIEKEIIQNKEIPLKSYNCSFIKDRLRKKYRQRIPLTTAISWVKKHGFYPKKTKRTIHDREVLTRYVGDSSYHLWAPAVQEKWYLITSLDDYSRLILYAALVKKETTWTHLCRLPFHLSICPRKGLPLKKAPSSHR